MPRLAWAFDSMAEKMLRAKLWVYQGQASWQFLSLPKGHAKRLKQMFGGIARGFGSLPVSVTIGATTWQTSVFPDSKAGTYLLPIKAQVRKKEGLKPGQMVSFSLRVLA